MNTIRSPLNELLGIRHPLLLAPMAGVAGGALAAAVSAAGGLGLIGGGYCDPEWIGGEFDQAGGARVGIGFIGWRLQAVPAVLDLALAREPAAVLLSFADISPYVARVHAAGATLLAQVQSVAQARAAAAAGADVIVAQGGEAGGHAGMRGTLPLVPAVVDAVSPIPVVAAGGIADGRGMAAALLLGAAGVMLGTRFYAARESLAHPGLLPAALAASGDDTVRSAVFDRLRGWDWPPGYALRSLRNRTTERWQHERAEMEQTWPREAQEYSTAVAAGDAARAAVIVGEAIDLVQAVQPAREVVAGIVTQAAGLLAAAPARLHRG